MARVILHVDLNSFFATAEQQANPALRGKPVGIVKAKGRTCVIAASVDAKKYGVRTGTNTWEAKKLCPQIILVGADFDKYAHITSRFINICKDYSPTVEVFSLDECFIDLTETEKLFGSAIAVGIAIKDRLREEVGDYMSCSVGISNNKLLAKLASEQIKPDGLFLIDETNALEILDRSELMDVCGLGWGLYGHLKKLGIDNFAALREKSLNFLKKHFGPFWSVHLYNICRGIDGAPVNSFVALEEAKSVGRTYTTHRNLYKKEEIWRLVRNLCEEAAAKARAMNLCGRYVGLTLRGGPARHALQGEAGGDDGFYGHKTLKHFVDDGKEFFDLCWSIGKNWKLPYVRFCGVTLSMMTKKEYLPTPLFADQRRRTRLLKTLDRVNGKWGDYTVFPAQLLGTNIIRPEVNGYFGDKAYQLKSIVPFKESP